MLRNFKQFLVIAGAAALAFAPALRAQSGVMSPGGAVRGDVDGDGKVTVADARIIADFVVGRAVPPGVSVAERGDVNGDGRVTSVDAAIVAAFAAGRDMSRYGVGHPESSFTNALARVTCRGDLRTRTLACDQPQLPNGTRALIVGGQNQYVKLTSSAPTYNSGTGDFAFTVTVQNLIAQALGTTDGTAADNDSVRVFFSQKPTPTGAGDTGSMDVSNATGTDVFTGTGQPYIEYPAPLAPLAVSEARPWHLQVTGTVTTFEFTVMVAGAVQFTNGWIDIYPPNGHAPSPTVIYSDTLAAGQTLQLTDSVRNAVGRVIDPAAPVNWTGTGHGAATVNSTGLVTAVADGVDSVTATVGGRTGKVEIVVSTASAAHSTITANPVSIVAADSSAITVQLRNAADQNVNHSGGTVALNASGGALTTVTDHNDGTYTAKYTNTAAGTYTVSGTLNGTPIGDSAQVTVTAGAADSLFVQTQNPQTGTAGQAVTSPPGVLVTDRYHNPVQGVNIRFGVTSGGGKLSNGGPAADSVDVATGANGIATVTSWTLGNSAGTNNNTVVAHPTAVTLLPASVTFTASADPGPPANMVKSAGDGQSATVGTAVAVAPAVTLTDSHGNPVSGVMVHFAVTGGGGTVVPDSAATNGSGVATTTSWTLGTTAGNNTLDASATGVSTVTFTATATAGAPANIAKTAGDGQTGNVGSPVSTAPQVQVTDQYGNPVPNITVNFSASSGGSTTGASPATDATGHASVGSWTLGGTAPFPNQLTATASGGSNPSTAFTAYVPPAAVTDSSQAIGNVSLGSGIVTNVLTNDVGRNGTGLTVTTTGNLSTVNGGTVNLAANGAVNSYTPPTWASPLTTNNRDSVQYTVDDGHATSQAYLKFRFVGKVWYVDGSQANGNGRDSSPFSSIANAEASAGTNDSILVRTGSGTTGGGTLKNGQLVYAQGATTAFTASINGNPVTLLSAGSAPTIGALTLGLSNTLRGFTDNGGITGGGFGTLTVTEVGINNPAGQALSLTNGTLSGSFGTLISGGGTNNVFLSNVSTSGTSTMGAGGNALSGSTGDAVVVTSGSGSFTFPGDVARGISVTNNTGGTLTFSGTKNINSGTGAGVTITGNAAAVNVAFTTGALTIATTTGTPFTATGAGTVTVSGASNTISATGAAASLVNLNGITLGASGMSFSSITGSVATSGPAFTATSVGNTSGSSFTASSLTVAGTAAGANRGLAVVTSSAPFTFTTVSVNGTGGEGIYLNGNTGAVNVNGGTVGNTSSTTGDALAVSGGNAAITVAAALTKSSVGRIANIGGHTAGAVTVSGALSCTGSCTGINLASNSGGTIDFTNASQTLNTGASAAVTLSSNTGATINFSGGSLAITTAAGAGINATGGGTVTVTGANNTVNSNSGGTAVNVSSTTIGGGGMTFKRIDATGSGTNGIVLSSTGAGAFTVTGDGASDPNNTTRGRTTAKAGGGTITLGSGGSISGRSGNGVTLASTGAVTLRNMVITGSASSGNGLDASSTGRLTLDNLRITGAPNDYGFLGQTVSGLAIYHSEIDNNATTAGVVEGPDIWNMRLVGLTGTDSITNSNIHHSQEDVLGILNSSGTLNLTVLNTNITDTGTGAGGTTAFAVSADGTANVTLNLQNDSINRGRARGVDFGTGTGSTAVFNTTINNSQFMQNGAAISIVQGSSGTNTFNITNNNLQSNDANSLQAMIINRAGSPSFNAFGLFTGTISGNTIGTTGVANSGSGTSNGIDVESNGSGGITRVAIVNNTIHQVGLHGISVAEVDANTGGTTPPLLEARVASNTISDLKATALDGINILPGALSTDDETMCIDIANNNSTGIRNGLRVRPSGLPAAPSTVQLEGWDGVTAVNTYFTNRPNTLAGGTAAISTTAPPSPGGFVAVANCNTP